MSRKMRRHAQAAGMQGFEGTGAVMTANGRWEECWAAHAKSGKGWPFPCGVRAAFDPSENFAPAAGRDVVGERACMVEW